MGLDVYTNLIVGVPLIELGTLDQQVERVDLVDPLGNLTGESTNLRQVYFSSLNGRTSLVGSNKGSIESYLDRVRYFYHELFDTEDEKDDWFHCSDYEKGIDQRIVGLLPESIKGSADGRYESFSASRFGSIQITLSKVRKFLKERFGYIDEVYIISLTHYSY